MSVQLYKEGNSSAFRCIPCEIENFDNGSHVGAMENGWVMDAYDLYDGKYRPEDEDSSPADGNPVAEPVVSPEPEAQTSSGDAAVNTDPAPAQTPDGDGDPPDQTEADGESDSVPRIAEADLEDKTDDQIRQLAKIAGIRSWHNKGIGKIKAELIAL